MTHLTVSNIFSLCDLCKLSPPRLSASEELKSRGSSSGPVVLKKRVRLATTRRRGLRRRVAGGIVGGVGRDAADSDQHLALLEAIEGMDFSHVLSACCSGPSPAQITPAVDTSLRSPLRKRQCKEKRSTVEPRAVLTSAHVPTSTLVAETPLLAGSTSPTSSSQAGTLCVAALCLPTRASSEGRVSVVKETPVACTGGGCIAEVRGHSRTATEATPTIAQDKTPPLLSTPLPAEAPTFRRDCTTISPGDAAMATHVHALEALCSRSVQQNRGGQNDDLGPISGATSSADTDLSKKDSNARSPSTSAGLYCVVSSSQLTVSSSQSLPRPTTSQGSLGTVSPIIPLQNLPPPPLPHPPTRPIITTGNRTICADTLSQSVEEGERTTIPDTYCASEKKVCPTLPQHVSASQPSPAPSGHSLPGLKGCGTLVKSINSSQPPPSLSTIPDTLQLSQQRASLASSLQAVDSITAEPSLQAELAGKCRLCCRCALACSVV